VEAGLVVVEDVRFVIADALVGARGHHGSAVGESVVGCLLQSCSIYYCCCHVLVLLDVDGRGFKVQVLPRVSSTRPTRRSDDNVGAEAGGREYVLFRQGQGKGRRRQVRDRQKHAVCRKVYMYLHPKSAPAMYPRARRAFGFTQMTALKQSSHISLIVTIIADTPVHVPAGLPNLVACVFQPSQ
jgi:hypothetical protein